jgi:hypothetical protein
VIKDYQNIIEALCDKFNNAITQLDIIAWLENFESADWKKALIVLSCFEYFSTRDVIKEFESGLKKIVEIVNPKEPIILLPVGQMGKSGAAMIYYLKKTPSFSNKIISILDNNDYSKIPENCKVVLVDDFSGSGETILKFYNSIRADLPKNHIVFALTVAYLEKAADVLDKNNIKLIGNSRIAAFASRGSVFGYYPKMKTIRSFCFEYGDKLYPETKYKEGLTKQHPLGYSNSQALVGFEHSIPNNCLSIIWADVKVVGTDRKWIPLFPRRGALIIDKSKEFKQSQRYWASIVYKLGLNENLFSSEEKYTKGTVQLISVIFLKKKQRSTLVICQMLGVNINEYGEIIKTGQAKNLFDDEEELTEQAIDIFEQLRKKVRFRKDELITSELLIEEDILYIPKVFRGGS